MRVLAITNMWPEEDRPWRGIFVARQMESLRPFGVRLDVLPISGQGASPRGSAAAYARAAAAIVKLNVGPRRFDVIHAHTGHCGVLACLQLRYPVVLSYVGYDIDLAAEDWEGPRTRLERFAFVKLSLVLAATIIKSRRAREKLPRPALGRSALIPNGVDRALFKPMDRGEARRTLGWDPDAPVVLFANDPSRHQKRFALAEQAMELARRQVPQLRLAICHQIEPDLVPVHMAAADALILSSVGEDSPNVVKEAMACDLPVVSVDVGDVRDIVSGTRHCHVCEEDAEALARALVAVAQVVPERSNGRSRSQHLGLSEIAERLLAHYELAMRRGPGPLGFLPRRSRLPETARANPTLPARESAPGTPAPAERGS